MKKFIELCFLITLFVFIPFQCFAFSDVNDAVLEQQIKDLTALNIINGYEDGTFKPNNTITRAEFSKIVMEAIINENNNDVAEKFVDVTEDHWAYNYIYKAKNANIINGTSETTFEPEANVTYEQAIKMIVCALGYGEEALSKGGWPNGYIKQAEDIGILNNIYFEQENFASRENIVKIIRNSLDIPFYYLNISNGVLEREFSETCLYDIKNLYINLNADEELLDNDDNEIIIDSEIEEDNSVG